MAVKVEAGTLAAVLVFLSRLCGGEVILNYIYHNDTFLSRLCGGEDLNKRIAITLRVSKPPMWR